MADPTAGNRRAFVDACSKGEVDEVRRMVEERGLSPDTAFDGMRGVAMAVLLGKSDVLQYLVSRGADINTNKSGLPLMLIAAESRSSECLRILIRAGADLEVTDKNGMTPLIRSAWSGRLSYVQALIDAGADVFKRDSFNCTARNWAEEQRRSLGDGREGNYAGVAEYLAGEEQKQLAVLQGRALQEDAERTYEIERLKTKNVLKQPPPFKFRRGW